MSEMNHYVVHVQNATKELKMGQVTVHALRGVTLTVEPGEFLSIIGPSGSGKSTLLGLIGGLDTPTAGKVYIDGTDITDLSERELTRIRNEKIGFVFQFFNLVPTLTALENVALPIQFARRRAFNPTNRAKELLTLLEVDDRMHHRPSQLSGGQQQRVAIARALANNPPLLLCDEPTGNLDTATGAQVMELLERLNQDRGKTVVVITHNALVSRMADRTAEIRDGRIVRLDLQQHRETARSLPW